MSAADLPSATDRLRSLTRLLEASPEFPSAITALRAGQPATFEGVWGSAAALLAGALVDASTAPLLVVCPQVGEVDELCADVSLLSPHQAWRFPAWEAEPAERLVHDEIFCERLRTLKRLASLPAAGRG